MAIITDYFTARSDQDAAAVVDSVGGPDRALSVTETVSLRGVDPLVKLARLEELLTGVSYDQISGNPRCGAILADRDGGERLVVTVTDELQSALAVAAPAGLADAATGWSRTEECRLDGFTADDCALVVQRLRVLAEGATRRGERLYCWMCV